MNDYKAIGTGIFVHEKVKIGKNVTIGHCSCIGFGDPDDGEIIIGDNVSIGAFCVVHFGVTISESVCIDHSCRIGNEVKIGKNTNILSGKEITYRAMVGENCIIGGDVPDRTVIEDDVTFMGEIAHSHRDASLPWEDTIEPSPTIYKGSFIGVNALIIGSVEIGPCAFIGAGEIVRVNVGKRMAYLKGTIRPLEYYKGIFNSRCK